MSTKQTSSVAKTEESPESIIQPIGKEVQATIEDPHVREHLLSLSGLAAGIVRAFTQPHDPEMRALAAALADVNIGLDDAKQLVADGQTVAELYFDRRNKEAVASAATTKLDAARNHARKQFQSYASILRGQFGATSASLEAFGVKRVGSRGGSRGKPKKPGDAPPETPPKS